MKVLNSTNNVTYNPNNKISSKDSSGAGSLYDQFWDASFREKIAMGLMGAGAVVGIASIIA